MAARVTYLHRAMHSGAWALVSRRVSAAEHRSRSRARAQCDGLCAHRRETPAQYDQAPPAGDDLIIMWSAGAGSAPPKLKAFTRNDTP